MTINDAGDKITYTADGSTTQWNFSFAVDDASHVFVVLGGGSVGQVLIPVGQYIVHLNPPVAPNPTPVGGFVTYPISGPPLGAGNLLTVFRRVPSQQNASISNQSIIYPPVIEKEFDYLTMLAQQASADAGRAFKVPITDPPPADLPPAGLRKNQLAIFDNNGNLAPGVDTGGAAISGAMLPVVTAPTLVDARTAMGVPPINSPAFTGNPTAPTPTTGDNDTSIATTAFVQAQIGAMTGQFASGTRMLFQQTAAPAGWTKDVTHNDKALRIVSGAAGSGGTIAFSTLFGRTATDGFTLTVSEMPFHGHGVSDPSHSHVVNDPTHTHTNSAGGTTFKSMDAAAGQIGGTGLPYNDLSIAPAATGISISAAFTGISISGAGGGQSHSHGIDTRVMYVDVIIAQRN